MILLAFKKAPLALRLSALLMGVPIFSIGPVSAHDDSEHCVAIKASINDAGFSHEVTVACNDNQALIASDTYPDHEMMTGIVGSNEQLPVPANYAAPIPLEPSLGATPMTRDAALGVAVNGVPIYDYTAGGEMSAEDLHHHQTRHDTLLTQQLDVCGGHAGRGDDYHYHVKPTCMIEQMANAGDDAIIGWAFDGYPIYGDHNPDGTTITAGALDVCNGQQDETFGYRYHTSEEAPYIVQCLMGEVASVRDLPRVPPLSPAGSTKQREQNKEQGKRRPKPKKEKRPKPKGEKKDKRREKGQGSGKQAGRPPRGGVQNLTFTEDASGNRSMDYTYEGEAYYMRYAPSDTAGCYLFETRTVTNNGVVEAGEYCR